MSDTQGPARALALLFAVSGAAALLIETTWLRWFGLLFGATAPATAATLVAFFAGQAVGAAAGARYVPRSTRPLRVYGGLEIAGALWALAVPIGLGWGEAATAGLYDSLGASPGALSATRFGIALITTLPAALCWGAAFPALAAVLLPEARGLGSRGSGLYALNLGGAAVGAAAAAFWLPEALGVSGTYGIGVGLQATVGAGAFLLARRFPSAHPSTTTPAARVGGAGPVSALEIAAGLSGFGTFAAQVLLVHAFALVLDQSVYAFGAVLVVVFASLAAGSAFVAYVYRSGRISPPAMLAAALVLSALGLAVFPDLFHRITGGLRYVDASGGWGPLGVALATAAAAAGPPLLATALVFPSVLAVAGTSSQDPAAIPVATRLGRLLAANTTGAVAGALLAPFALLPGLGPWRAFAALAVVYGAAAVLVPTPNRRARLWQAGALAVGWMLVLGLANPLALAAVTAGPGEVVLFEATTPAGAVAVLERNGERLIRTDNHYNLGGSRDSVHQERQGHLPLLLHPGARRVAFLGSATGISAGAATLHPIAAMSLVEIVPGVAQAAIHHFHDANRGVHEDPRTRLVLDDARNFLRVTSDRFDAIVGDLFVPWRSGTHALYAREHFAAARQRLEPGGLFCQWLPLYQLTEEQLLVIAATFLDVFPQSAVFRGDFFGRFPIIALVGWKGQPAPAAAVSAAAARLAKALDSDRWLTDPVGIWSLYVGPLGPLAPDLVDLPRNRDDRPRIAFLAARSHVGGSQVLSEPMSGLRWVRFQESLQRAAQNRGDDVYPDLDEPQRAAVRGGAWLQIASALWVAGRADEASQALERAAHSLPRHLLADAPADPTAADVWPDH